MRGASPWAKSSPPSTPPTWKPPAARISRLVARVLGPLVDQRHRLRGRALKVTQGYVMHALHERLRRTRSACRSNTTGRSSPWARNRRRALLMIPAKGQTDADFRFWGGNSWFQNTRQVYWPMIAAGDFDLLAPFFKQYRDSLALATDRTKPLFRPRGRGLPRNALFLGPAGQRRFRLGQPGRTSSATPGFAIMSAAASS